LIIQCTDADKNTNYAITEVKKEGTCRGFSRCYAVVNIPIHHIAAL